MRGEHIQEILFDMEQKGSSPHARGTQPDGDFTFVPVRLIPACAGNTLRFHLALAQSRAHPRMRGEHQHRCRQWVHSTGSSPHARGTLLDMPRSHRPRGLIPACAGNTVRGCALSLKSWAHPRMRGEHNHAANALRLPTGSSPHARGTRAASPFRDALTGLIPACAGNTSQRLRACHASGAHPRMRGEHAALNTEAGKAVGSSPHARGTLPCCPGTPAPGRLIPACAGNTVCGDVAAIVKRAHPRMRGEHSAIAIALRCTDGSSPHARGTHVFTPTPGKGDGLIPACAGNTLSPPPPPPRPWAHPRMRGEHTGVQLRFRRDQGSSPHARGTQDHNRRHQV